MEDVSSWLYIPHSRFVLQLTFLAKHLSLTSPPASVKLMLLDRLLSMFEQGSCRRSSAPSGCAPAPALEQDVSPSCPPRSNALLLRPVSASCQPSRGLQQLNSIQPKLKIAKFLKINSSRTFDQLRVSAAPEECLWTVLVLTP